MSSAVTGGATTLFKYDALGRRVAKGNTVYAMAGQQVVAEYALGAASASPSETYVYGSYIDEPILKTGTGGKVYYARNQQYSVVALLNATGDVVERYAYSAYGALTIMNAAGTVLPSTLFGNSYTFTGRRYDSETELYYFRARYYDARSLARFISKDPLGYTDGMNLFAAYFVPNAVDPFGLKISKCNCKRTTRAVSMGGGGQSVSKWDVFTTGDCQTACCREKTADGGFAPGAGGWSRTCEGTPGKATADELAAISLCSVYPSSSRLFRACEKSIAGLMTNVSGAQTKEGSKKEKYCFQFMDAMKKRCGCKPGASTIDLPGCTIEFWEVEPFPHLLEDMWGPPTWLPKLFPETFDMPGQIVPTRRYPIFGWPTNGFSAHGIARLLWCRRK